MTGRYVSSGSPGVHKGPEPQYWEETWQDWLRRQGRGPGTRPIPAPRKNVPATTSVGEAIVDAVAERENGPVAAGPFEDTNGESNV